MRSVARMLESKFDQTVYTIGPTASVFDAVKLMAGKNMGAVAVPEGERIVGIIAGRDYAGKIVLIAVTGGESAQILDPDRRRSGALP